MKNLFSVSGTVDILKSGIERDLGPEKDPNVLFEAAPPRPIPLTPQLKTLSDFLPPHVTKESLKAASDPSAQRHLWNERQLDLCRQFLTERINKPLAAEGITPQYSPINGDFIPPKVAPHWVFNGFLIAGLFGAFLLLIVNESSAVQKLALACGFCGMGLLLGRWITTERRRSSIYKTYLHIRKSLPDQIIAEATAKAEEANTAERAMVERHNKAALAQYAEKLNGWKQRKQDFFSALSATDLLIKRCENVLSRSQYPDSFPREFSFSYSTTDRIMAVDYRLPNVQCIMQQVGAFCEENRVWKRNGPKKATTALINDTYDAVLYQMCLRTIYEICQGDTDGFVSIVVLNGWVDYIDQATGHTVNTCVLSVQVTKDEFLSLNLSQVDAKACFRALKGISGGKLHGMTPVKPVLQLNMKDSRFVAAYDVADTLDESMNLASMDWLDFENLIREIFDKEFGTKNGQVKLTQSSRDGGVDAVVFDTDPIRGGKIVIQAKRYTNVVGVAAVRDLYGTVINEGANKGILITTAHYGADAYEFAKDKPLTLLNGDELLYILQKHGYKARINIAEAKASGTQ
jgi:HJR/Mrr/RecB family endonuclease